MDDRGINRESGGGITPAGDNATRSVGAFNRFGRWALAGFLFGFGIFFVSAVLIPLKGGVLFIKGALIISGVLVMIGSATGVIVAIVARDAVASGRKPWSFTLRTMLIATTLVAVVLGLIVWLR
jgi:hypothetical protein